MLDILDGNDKLDLEMVSITYHDTILNKEESPVIVVVIQLPTRVDLNRRCILLELQ